MARARHGTEAFGLSFLDVLANTIGGLAFLLVIAVLMVGPVFTSPVITTKRLPVAYQGQPYETWLAAREGLGKFRWSYGTGTIPPGLKLEERTGRLWGKPEVGKQGGEGPHVFEFEVLCTAETENPENPLRDVRRYQLEVVSADIEQTPLQIMTDERIPEATVGVAYPLVLAAMGGQPPYRWSADGPLPAGLQLSEDGRVRGVPTQPGQYRWTVRVAAADRETQKETLSLKVAEECPTCPEIPPLRVATADVPPAIANTPYKIWPSAEGGLPPYAWRPRSQPQWLVLNEQGTAFEGTPGWKDVGKRAISWTVTDAAGTTANSRSIQLVVTPPTGSKPPPLKLLTTTLPKARAKEAYVQVLSVRGGYPPYQWEGTMPPGSGLNFDTEMGAIRGTPKRRGTQSLKADVSDQSGASVSAQLKLKVMPAEQPLKLLTKTLPKARKSEVYRHALAATGGYPNYRWRIAKGPLPPGLRLDAKTGIIGGTPVEAGSFPVAIAVSDAQGNEAPEHLNADFVVLTERNVTKLRITTEELPALMVSKPVKLALACEGGLEPYSWRVAGQLPSGLKLRDGALQGIPLAAGRHELSLSASDATGQRAIASVLLLIERVVPSWLALMAALLALLLLLVAFWLWRRIGRLRPVELRITTDSIPSARASFFYSVQLAAEGGLHPYRWRVIDGELPPGMELSESGLLHGTPFERIGVDSVREINFTVQVTDAQGHSASRQL